MMEHRAASLLVRVLTCAFTPWGGPVWLDDAHPELVLVCRLAYRVLYASFKDNRDAEIAVSAYIQVFIGQVCVVRPAVRCTAGPHGMAIDTRFRRHAVGMDRLGTGWVRK